MVGTLGLGKSGRIDFHSENVFQQTKMHKNEWGYVSTVQKPLTKQGYGWKEKETRSVDKQMKTNISRAGQLASAQSLWNI